MSYSVNWHVTGRLEVAWINPTNGGSITLAGEDGEQFNLFTNANQWWALFCALPKGSRFFVSMPDTVGYRHERDEAVYMPYLKSFLVAKEAAE